jgi:hypothetical protein
MLQLVGSQRRRLDRRANRHNTSTPPDHARSADGFSHRLGRARARLGSKEIRTIKTLHRNLSWVLPFDHTFRVPFRYCDLGFFHHQGQSGARNGSKYALALQYSIRINHWLRYPRARQCDRAGADFLSNDGQWWSAAGHSARQRDLHQRGKCGSSDQHRCLL